MKEEQKEQPSATAITHVEALRAVNARETWQAELKWLGTPRAFGHRNLRLCSVARNGLATGLAPEQVVQEMKRAGGTAHPLTEQECRRAVGTVLHSDEPECRPAGKTDGGAFFRAMVKSGACFTEDNLWGKPPCRRKQCRLHINAIFDACDEAGTPGSLWWTGRHAWSPRDRKSLGGMVKVWNRTPMHQFVIPSPMSATFVNVPNSDGKGTHPCFACKATVKAAPLVVCEFDHLPPERQFAFWAGVLCEQSLDVRSIVWSGSRSYHALVKVPNGRDRAEYVAYLRSIMPGIDPAPMHTAGLTRLAGGINETTGAVQRLVWTHCQ